MLTKLCRLKPGASMWSRSYASPPYVD